ncbi:hypothetical protein HDV03_003061 [Kappamyces sp. JEL0829]|nr:hypothetical protein HDV03_003061 [Kappamyces sp. JEL0829]
MTKFGATHVKILAWCLVSPFALICATCFSAVAIVWRRFLHGPSPYPYFLHELSMYLTSFMAYRLDHDFINWIGKLVPPPRSLSSLSTALGIWLERSRTGKKKKTLFYIHGGGFVVGNATTFLAGGQLLSYRSGIETLLNSLGRDKWQAFSVEYPVAPHTKYPGQLDIAFEALEYVAAQPFVGDIVFIGDSAGANLCIALLMKVTSLGPSKAHLLPKALVAISPWLDLSRTDYPQREYDMLSSRFLLESAADYSSKDEARTGYVSPLLATTHDLRRTFSSMKVFFSYGGLEVFKSDILKFADRLRTECGIDSSSIRLDEDPALPHNYQMIPQVFGERSRIGMDRVAAWLQNIH